MIFNQKESDFNCKAEWDYRNLSRPIFDASTRHGLDPVLVSALCIQESAGDPQAIRYEPKFYDTYIGDKKPKRRLGGHFPPANKVSGMTERRLRSFSFGLMQVMGQTAREFGYDSDYLTDLCIVEHGLEMGCRILAKKLERKGGDMKQALLSYNGGGNKLYTDKVYSHIESGEYLKIFRP